MESWILLVGGEDLQTLHQWETGIDHDRELAKENRDLFSLDFARAESRHGKFFAFFPDGPRRDALAAQLGGQHLFVGGCTLAADFLSRCGLS